MAFDSRDCRSSGQESPWFLSCIPLDFQSSAEPDCDMCCGSLPLIGRIVTFQDDGPCCASHANAPGGSSAIQSNLTGISNDNRKTDPVTNAADDEKSSRAPTEPVGTHNGDSDDESEVHLLGGIESLLLSCCFERHDEGPPVQYIIHRIPSCQSH